MITEILDSCEEAPDNRAATTRRHRRRRALVAVCPLVLGGATVDAVAMAAPEPPGASLHGSSPGLPPAATPCPTPRMVPRESAPQVSVPSVLLANHQPCNHHEGMVTAFRWL
jgi:hypothetical protein